MNDQSIGKRVREGAKLALRGALYRADLDLGRGPYPVRLARVLRARGIDTVVDVGANVGQFGALLRSAGYRGRIVSVEPLSGAYAVLSRRAARDGSWSTFRAAVSEGSSATMHVAANSYSSSLLPMTDTHVTAAPGSEIRGVEDVPCITVPELFANYRMEPERTLLKVDTQGFEDRVLDSAGDLLDHVAAIQLELSFVELYAGQALFDDLVARVRSRGLVLWSLETGFSDATGRLMQCDGLFVRPEE